MPPGNPGQRISPYAATIGMWIFLSALGMLFAASLMGYAAIRLTGLRSPELGSIRNQFPKGLWLSTALVLAASMTIHLAVKSVRRERQKELRRWLVITSALAVLFVGVQVPSLKSIYDIHRSMVPAGLGPATTAPFASEPPAKVDSDVPPESAYSTASSPRPVRGAMTPVYGLVFFMILLHAAHVVGGVVALAMVTVAGFAGKYDHEHYNGVKHAAMYWHFLDGVWMVMFLGMFALG